MAIAERGYGLVYGGASVGLMGAVADGALAAGGSVVGVIPKSIADLEIAHPHLSELIVVETMHQRKAHMIELSEHFVVLPGGIGSLEETFEVMTWSQLGIHRKAIGLLNVDGFYDLLETFLDQLVQEGFVKESQRHILLAETDPDTLLTQLERTEVVEEKKWIDS